MANDSGEEEAVDWGDDDEFLSLATQLENEINDDTTRAIHSRDIGNNPSKTTPENETRMLHRTGENPETVFNARRQKLTAQASTSTTVVTDQAIIDLKAELSHLKERVKNAEEKEKKSFRELCTSRGECANVRRELEKVKQGQQQDSINFMRKEQTLKKAYDAEKEQLNGTLKSLRTELQMKNNEIISLQSKQAMNSSSLNTSIQKVSPQLYYSKGPSSKSGNGFRSKSGSDPNISVNQAGTGQQRILPQTSKSLTSHQAHSPVSPKIASVKKVDVIIQMDKEIMDLDRSDSLAFENAGAIRFNKLKTIESFFSMDNLSDRQRIYETLFKSVEMEYRKAKPVIREAVHEIPNRIMLDHAPGLEIRASLYNHLDYLFHFAKMKDRVKQYQERGLEFKEPVYPILPNAGSDCVVDLTEVGEEIENRFVHGGIWATLKLIKSRLKTLLESCSKSNRYKLLAKEPLIVLWHLLAWAKQLWKLVVLEEEFEDIIVNVGGKETWTEELAEWTGLILKVDWRDLFDPDLEMTIRQLSLSILSSIMVSGYFEDLPKRYEILYRILKDTLSKSYLRTPKTLRKILIILTWSVADRSIINYLCVANSAKHADCDSNCLARSVADAVLKCFKETNNHYEATVLLALYLNLLENLMHPTPHYMYASRLARSRFERKATCLNDLLESNILRDNEAENQEDKTESNHHNMLTEKVNGEPMEMDIDDSMIMTQFVDTERYHYEDGCKEREALFNDVKDIKCWLNPKDWETVPNQAEKRCQCRRFLLGNAFIMLSHTTKFWVEAFEKHEQEIEQTSKQNEIKLNQIEEFGDTEVGSATEEEQNQKLLKRMESMRKFVTEFLSQSSRSKEKMMNASGKEELKDETDDEPEWSSEDLLRYLRKASSFANEHGLDWASEMKRKENIYDYVLRRGAMMKLFVDNECENIALALRSEAFGDFTLFEAFFKLYRADLAHLTIIEKRNLFPKTPNPDDNDAELGYDIFAEQDSDVEDLDREDIIDYEDFYNKNKNSLQKQISTMKKGNAKGGCKEQFSMQNFKNMIEEMTFVEKEVNESTPDSLYFTPPSRQIPSNS